MKNRKGLEIFFILLRVVLGFYFGYSITNNYGKLHIAIIGGLCYLVWGILGYIEGIFDGIKMEKSDKENKFYCDRCKERIDK
jgi:hypothetical protein